MARAFSQTPLRRMLALVSSKRMTWRPSVVSGNGWLFEKNGRAKPVANSSKQRQRNSSSQGCSSFLLRVARGGTGLKNMSELNGIRSRAERRIRWKMMGPVIATAPSKNHGVRKFMRPGRVEYGVAPVCRDGCGCAGNPAEQVRAAGL